MIAFCMSYSLLLYYRDKKIGTSLVLGTAAALKVIPGVVLFIHSFVSDRRYTGKILLFLLGISISLVLTIPFIIHGDMSVIEAYVTNPGIGAAGSGNIIKLMIRLSPLMIVSLIVLVRSRLWHDYLPDAMIVLIAVFILTVCFEDRYILWIYPAIIIYAAKERKAALLPIVILLLVNLSTLTFYSGVTTNAFSPLAGRPLHIDWIPEYCAAHGLIAPHKIFKTLTKLFMAILVIRILFQKRNTSCSGKANHISAKDLETA